MTMANITCVMSDSMMYMTPPGVQTVLVVPASFQVMGITGTPVIVGNFIYLVVNTVDGSLTPSAPTNQYHLWKVRQTFMVTYIDLMSFRHPVTLCYTPVNAESHAPDARTS